MAALSRPTEATYTIHESVTVDTTDREDHTFCGIMFPIKAKKTLPVHSIVINSISVRGRLGPLTVWVTKDEKESSGGAASARAASNSSTSTRSSRSQHGYNLRQRTSQRTREEQEQRGGGGGEISMRQRNWTKIYEKTHAPSFRDYCVLDLSANPVVLQPGQVRGMYVHSTLPGDEAIVYDNKHKRLTHDDGFVSVLPGRAHVSETPFGTQPIWGWGNAWRDNREFVGRISYGAVYRLWNPKEHRAFGGKFQRLVTTLFACQRRWESPISMLPDDCIFFILNMCRWDWVSDTADDIREDQKKARRLMRLKQQEMEEGRVAEDEEEEKEDGKMPAAAATATSAVARGDMLGEDEIDDGDEDYSEDDSDYDSYDEYRNMSSSTFYYRDYEEDDSDDEAVEAQQEEQRRRTWLRSQFARVSVLRALASMNNGEVAMELDSDDS